MWFCRRGLKHYHVRTYIYIAHASHTYTMPGISANSETLPRTRTRKKSSPRLSSSAVLGKLFLTSDDTALGSATLLSWRQLSSTPSSPDVFLFFHSSDPDFGGFGFLSSIGSECLIVFCSVGSSARLSSAFIQWLRGFGIFCSDVFRSADFCSGCRQSIGLGFCWDGVGKALGCPRLGLALRIYTKPS